MGTREVLDELRVPTRELHKTAPDASAGFGQMRDEAAADGVLSRRVKELMALIYGPQAWATFQEFSTPKPE